MLYGGSSYQIPTLPLVASELLEAALYRFNVAVKAGQAEYQSTLTIREIDIQATGLFSRLIQFKSHQAGVRCKFYLTI